MGRARARPHRGVSGQASCRDALRRRGRPARAAVVGGDGRRVPPDGRRNHSSGAARLRPASHRQSVVAKADFRLRPTVHAAVHIGGGLHHAFPESRRRILSVERRRGGGSRAAAARASSAPRSSISTCTTATARPSSSRATRESSPSRCTSSTTTRCGSREARSTSACPMASRDMTYLEELEKALPTVMASRPECVFYLAGADPYERRSARRPAADPRGTPPARPDGHRRRHAAQTSRWSSSWPAVMRATSRHRCDSCCDH